MSSSCCSCSHHAKSRSHSLVLLWELQAGKVGHMGVAYSRKEDATHHRYEEAISSLEQRQQLEYCKPVGKRKSSQHLTAST